MIPWKNFLEPPLPREANQVAHVLASWSLKNKYSDCFVLGSAPSSFCNVLTLEQVRILVS